MDSVDEITPQTPPFRRPADYYSSPVADVKPVFPRWVSLGCGTASIVLLIILIAGAAGVSTGAFSGVFELVFASMQGEIDKMMGPDVKPPQKAAFDAEMKKMRASIRNNHLKLDQVQPLMKTLREVSFDEHVSSAEVNRLTREIHQINLGAR